MANKNDKLRADVMIFIIKEDWDFFFVSDVKEYLEQNMGYDPESDYHGRAIRQFLTALVSWNMLLPQQEGQRMKYYKNFKVY